MWEDAPELLSGESVVRLEEMRREESGIYLARPVGQILETGARCVVGGKEFKEQLLLKNPEGRGSVLLFAFRGGQCQRSTRG